MVQIIYLFKRLLLRNKKQKTEVFHVKATLCGGLTLWSVSFYWTLLFTIIFGHQFSWPTKCMTAINSLLHLLLEAVPENKNLQSWKRKHLKEVITEMKWTPN